MMIGSGFMVGLDAESLRMLCELAAYGGVLPEDAAQRAVADWIDLEHEDLVAGRMAVCSPCDLAAAPSAAPLPMSLTTASAAQLEAIAAFRRMPPGNCLQAIVREWIGIDHRLMADTEEDWAGAPALLAFEAGIGEGEADIEPERGPGPSGAPIVIRIPVEEVEPRPPGAGG